jgi:hypothetical protein
MFDDGLLLYIVWSGGDVSCTIGITKTAAAISKNSPMQRDIDEIVKPISEDGPRIDSYHNHEIPEHQWTTCRGCPSLRVFDFHYFFCRRLGDQTRPDEWDAGWSRLHDIAWNEDRPAACGLAIVDEGQTPHIGRRIAPATAAQADPLIRHKGHGMASRGYKPSSARTPARSKT